MLVVNAAPRLGLGKDAKATLKAVRKHGNEPLNIFHR
jgi:hypothetical protein